jgi:hypothetical protein
VLTKAKPALLFPKTEAALLTRPDYRISVSGQAGSSTTA